MFDPKSDYALNKMNPEAIVYIDPWGTLVRLTLEDFSSPEEFQRWKAWSDESYRQIENAGIAFYNGTWVQHLTIHYNCVGAITIPGALPLPMPDITVNTRKGVYVSYQPDTRAG